MSAVDLSDPLRAAILGSASIAALLPAYLGSKPVFTRAPSPQNAPYPLIMIDSALAIPNADGVNDWRPMPLCGITAFCRNDTPAHYAVVIQLGFLIRNLFHRNRLSITVPDWSVTGIEAQGPETRSGGDDQTYGSTVTLSVSLAQLRS